MFVNCFLSDMMIEEMSDSSVGVLSSNFDGSKKDRVYKSASRGLNKPTGGGNSGAMKGQTSRTSARIHKQEAVNNGHTHRAAPQSRIKQDCIATQWVKRGAALKRGTVAACD